MIHDDVKIIATQHFISTFFHEQKKPNNILNSYGGPFFFKSETIHPKIFTDNFTICFTSMGNMYEKGANIYIDIVTSYLNKYPNNNVAFVSIGNCFDHPKIKKYPLMSQTELSLFYHDNVDVYINLDSGISLNGFPLGTEAGLEGCILLTTDIHQSNVGNNFNFDDFFIIDAKCIDHIVSKINFLYNNRSFMSEKSLSLQQHIYALFNYDTIMDTIFNFIES